MVAILNAQDRNIAKPNEERLDSVMFASAFADMDLPGAVLIPWEARANEIDARQLAAPRALKLLRGVWAKDKQMQRFDMRAIGQMERFFDFATVAADRDIIRQGEHGDFMIVLLEGSIAVDRVHPWGENLRLAEARPGDILGEMSLLDSGMRFSQCTSLTECQIAILSASALDEMLSVEPLMAGNLIGLLARKLSMRLRIVSARLTESRRG